MERENIAWSVPERNKGFKIKEVVNAGELKRETESLIHAAQEQALRTNAVKSGNDHQNVFSLCRLCKGKVESVTHVVSSCSALAKNQSRKNTTILKKSTLAPLQEI